MLFAELPACWTSLLIWVKLSWSQLGSLTCIVVDLQWTGPRSSQMRHLICGPSFFILILQQAKPGFFMWQYLGSCQLGYEIAYRGFFHILLARKEELRPRWKLLQNHALCREWWRVGIIFAISVLKSRALLVKKVVNIGNIFLQVTHIASPIFLCQSKSRSHCVFLMQTQ